MADENRTVEKKYGNFSEYNIQMNRWILKPIGAWPITNSTTTVEKIMSRILTVVCWFISLFTIIPGVLNIILEKEDIYLKLKTLGPLSHWCVGGFNYAVLLLRKSDIHYCIEHIRTDWKMITRSEDQQVMLKNAKLGRRVAGFCAAFMQGGVFSTCIVYGVFTSQTIQVGNETMVVYGLPCPPYKLPIQLKPIHDIILGTQFLSAFVVTTSATGAFGLAAVFASHAVGQLNIMMAWVNEFVNQHLRCENENASVSKVGAIVEHHLRVLSFIAHIERIMSPICFMEMFKCMLGMCMASYYILVEWSEYNIQNLITYTMILISMTCNIFLVCYIGEVLSEKCKNIGDMVYMTNWYRLPDKDILSLIMIIRRSSVKVKMTAGKIIDMSLFTFASVCLHNFFNLKKKRIQSKRYLRNHFTMTDKLVAAKKKYGNLGEYSIQLSRWYLKPMGVWPDPVTTRREKILAQISIVVCWCIILFTVIPAFLHVVLVNEDIYLKLKTLGPLSHWCVDGFNYLVLLLRQDDISYCVERIRSDWKMITRTQDQEEMWKSAKLGRSIASFCAGFMQGTIFCTCFVLGAFKRTVEVGNKTVDIYTLPCPAYKFPVQTNPTHDVILGTQFLSALVVSSSAAGSFTLATIFASHALGQLNIMVTWVNEFTKRSGEKGKKAQINEIGIIVEHHLRVLSLIARIERIMSPICFMETFKCMLGMCMPSYYILAEWSEHNIQALIIYVMVFLSMTFNIFLVCYIGEVLKEQWVWKPLGIYAFIYNRRNKFEKMTSVVLILTSCSILQFVIVPFGYYTLFYERDIDTKIKLMGPLTFCLTSLIKYGYLGMKSSEFGRCVKHIEEDWKMLRDDDHRAIMVRYLTMGRKLITLCATFMYTGGLSYHTIMPLLSKKISENVTIRPLTYPGYEAFFDIQESPTYEIVYCMHCVYVLITGNITMAAYSLTAICTTHACGQIKIQTSRLKNLREDRKALENGIEDRLAVVVREHAKILSGGLSYHTVMQFVSKRDREENSTYRPLVYPGYDTFMDAQSSPTYEIVFSLHCFADIIMYSAATAAYSLAAIFVTHICGQIQIQIAKLHNLVKSKERKDGNRDPLSLIVYEHVQILSTATAAYSLAAIFVTHICGQIQIQIARLHNLVKSKQRKDVPDPLSVIVHDHAEILRQIGVNSYKIEWYNLPAKDAYDLILLIAISQYPPKLTAGKVIELSLDTFSSVS
ncbi:hypothetical protein WN51_13789 [Melipona quadrifasciata]|uniref:Odorant receptor 13a n=1 Tax=Melipona quadrifasciata TaxID=166423 RepID=A0A0N0BFR0_9HYME|nr:hypothetical protein WN51_13789 [Melipona quadrifasciata]